MARVRYVLVRVAQTVFMLWFVLTFLFFFFRLLPGDFTTQMVFAGADPGTIEAVREDWGLNDPLHIQYWRYLTNFLALDLGVSTQYRIPVWEHTKFRIFNTFILAAPGITLAYVLGAGIGTVTGSRRGTLIEKWGIAPLIFLGSFPAFFLAIVFIIVFAGMLDLLPTSGMLSPGTASSYVTWWGPYLTTDFLSHYTLPFGAILCRYLFIPSLIMRTSIVEVMDQDFTVYHRLTGLSKVNRMKHLARHASLPVITLYPVSMSRALGGLVLIETVFNWPGIGFTLVEAVFARDYPTVQFVFFIVAAFVIVSNLIVDILYGIIDPRVSVEE